MSSLNHSVFCLRIIRQLIENPNLAPFTNIIFVTTKDGEKKFTNQTIESEDIKVDFKKIFSN